jgi:hypothetical protein
MGDVINLRQARKARARHNAAQLAAQNRASHGQTLAERNARAAAATRAAQDLAGKRLDDGDSAETPTPDPAR